MSMGGWTSASVYWPHNAKCPALGNANVLVAHSIEISYPIHYSFLFFFLHHECLPKFQEH